MSIPQGYECGGSTTGCPTGYYIDDTPPSGIPSIYQKKVCQDCGKGYSCAGGTEREECPLGTYSSSINSASCSSCPTNHTTKSTASTSEGDCAPCPAGNVLNSQKTCDPCPIGTFLPNDGTSCQDCPEGHIASSKALSACTICPPGKEANATRSLCVDCPAGTVREAGVTKQCTPCPSGFLPNDLRTTCIIDCSGNKQPSSNGQSCVCKPGFGGTNCDKCELGTYSSGGTLNDCTTCADYTYTESTGASSCQSCDNLNGKPYSEAALSCFKGQTSFYNPPDGKMVFAVGTARPGAPADSKNCSILPSGSFLADPFLAIRAGSVPEGGPPGATAQSINGIVCGTVTQDGKKYQTYTDGTGCRMADTNAYSPPASSVGTSEGDKYIAGYGGGLLGFSKVSSTWGALGDSYLGYRYTGTRSTSSIPIWGNNYQFPAGQSCATYQPKFNAFLATTISAPPGNSAPKIGWNPLTDPKSIPSFNVGSTTGQEYGWNTVPRFAILSESESETYRGSCFMMDASGALPWGCQQSPITGKTYPINRGTKVLFPAVLNQYNPSSNPYPTPDPDKPYGGISGNYNTGSIITMSGPVWGTT